MSANTAIYQSQPAIIFLISIPILRERVTVVKIFSVLFSMAGVLLISFFSSKSSNAPPTSLPNSTELVLDEYQTLDSFSLKLDSSSEETNTPLGYVVRLECIRLRKTMTHILEHTML